MIETCIDLLRHGEAAGGNCYRGSRDDALTNRGWEQMRVALGADTPWHRIISSPLVRCLAFAADLAQRHSLPLDIDDRLREIHFGTWEGKTVDELLGCDREGITRFWEDPENYPPPGGERLSMFRTRVMEAWQELLLHHAGKHVLIVTHGGPIRIILGQVRNLPLADMLRLDVPHGYRQRLEFPLGAGGSKHVTLREGR